MKFPAACQYLSCVCPLSSFTWKTNEKCDTKHASEWHQRLNINNACTQSFSRKRASEYGKKTTRQRQKYNIDPFCISSRITQCWPLCCLLLSFLFSLSLSITLLHVSPFARKIMHGFFMYVCSQTHILLSNVSLFISTNSVIYLHRSECVNVILVRVQVEFWWETSKWRKFTLSFGKNCHSNQNYGEMMLKFCIAKVFSRCFWYAIVNGSFCLNCTYLSDILNIWRFNWMFWFTSIYT